MQSLKTKARELPNKPGVYLMRDRLGRVIYAGKARSLRKRVSQYFQASRKMRWNPKTAALIDSIADFETFTVKSEAEATLLEGKLIKEFKPHYNVLFKDDKRFLLVKVDMRENYPQFKFARLKKDDGARYFGPFAHATAVKLAMQWIRKKYGVLIQGKGGAPKTKDLKYSNYLVPVPLADMPREEYLRRVALACGFLEGGNKDAHDEIESQMREAAKLRQFEKAAELRDVLHSLRDIARTARERKFARNLSPKIDLTGEMAELQRVLGLSSVPSHIEGFDISHISGTLSVASTVCFRDGKPHKAHYRHYRIRTVTGSDDFASIAEVVGRRYRRVLDEGGRLPDLVMVDGGAGQLNAALAALTALGITELPVIGLAKQFEEIYRPGETQPIRLERASPALHLVQRLRDEAHRFANAYHQTLRKRRIQESVLDEFPGLGEKRKRLLLQRFGSIQRLRQATEEEIASVPGIGPKQAAALRTFLAGNAQPVGDAG
ncbi:MAG: excinuclease ABC subunit UvrC [Verrucomicrobia bacterium]|nr:excinuclease ABC subunit UvrC [Verrucomicrobiota bacterium]